MSGGAIRVNGAMEALAPNVAALLAAKGLDQAKGLAVALNERVVPRSAWAETALRAGDEIEIVRAVGGG
ncbi:sulfur carrier protein ThiS [Acidiphilium acidophilum]|uniref:Sulfur carrier protein ThiS n=1 Tax=Acidiphilium acidophilum TaxID=76588 RepID=A0AAW9DNJ0_ACIAO|nr:sulfur carrier protein ThiS [Acidiphilium acidophilum]MDX5930734.1 sulfur carrier protein ThiS [Acidiphilium acidophilum]MEE3501459.1 sulfur carrier protein ThiS [Acidiphilium acidophilum]GBQ20676.1 thiamine biosynthesis protein ThiS [Acidiphilium acidophilum DSM 700]